MCCLNEALMDEWEPALRKLREGHYREKNSMSKGMARKNRKLRCPVDRPQKGQGVDTRLRRVSNVILLIMGISYCKCNTTNHI